MDLYHERWQSETTYFPIKATMLDGRVLRSRCLTGLDQDVYALLTTYQALIRAASDTACTRPGLDMDRISFTPADHRRRHRDHRDRDPAPTGPADLVGNIGRAVLDALHPARHRHRSREGRCSSRGGHPAPKDGPGSGRADRSAQPVAVVGGERGGDGEAIRADERLPPLDRALVGVVTEPVDREQCGGLGTVE